MPGLCSHPFSACLALSHSHFVLLLFLRVSHPLAHSLYLLCLSPSNTPPLPARLWFHSVDPQDDSHIYGARRLNAATRSWCCQTGFWGSPDWAKRWKEIFLARQPPQHHQQHISSRCPLAKQPPPPLLLWPAAQTVVKLAHSQLWVWMLKLYS